MSEVSSIKISAETDSQHEIQQQRPPSNLNLRHNDNAFHVLASLIVEFFQSRLVEVDSTKFVTVSLLDKNELQRLLPKTVMWDFIDAVGYRLEMTPVVPVTEIHFLIIECQELCLDKEEIMENPILATYEIVNTTTEAVVTIKVLTIPSNKTSAESTNVEDDSGSSYGDIDYKAAIRQSSRDEDENIGDDCDGYVHTNFVVSDSSDLSSSDGSGIKVASSKDIDDEMTREEATTKLNINENKLSYTAAILSDNDSMPTEYSDDDYVEFLDTDNKIDPEETLAYPEVNQSIAEDVENLTDICDGSKRSKQWMEESVLQSELIDNVEAHVKKQKGDADIYSENKIDPRETLADPEVVQLRDDEQNEIDVCDVRKYNEQEMDLYNTLQNEHVNIAGKNNDDATGAFNNDETAAQLDLDGTIDEGEEIEMLPTLTCTFDEKTQIPLQDEIVNGSEVINMEDIHNVTVNEIEHVEIAEEIVVLATAAIENTTTGAAIENTTTGYKRSIPTVTGIDIDENEAKQIATESNISSQDRERMPVFDGALHDESMDVHDEEILPTTFTERSNERLDERNTLPDVNQPLTFLNEESNFGTACLSDNKQDEFLNNTEPNSALSSDDVMTDAIATEVKKFRESLSHPDVNSRPKTAGTADENSVSVRMQDVAGAFFNELRNVIDEKVEEFEYALVNAIVSKPIPRPKKEFREELPVAVHATIKVTDNDSVASKRSKFEESLRETIPVNPSMSSSKVTNKCIQSKEPIIEVATRNDHETFNEADFTSEGSRNIEVEGGADRIFEKPISPTSFSVQSGFSSLFIGLAAGFTPTAYGGDARSVQSKNIIATFPSDESNTKGTDGLFIDYSMYESMEVTDKGTKQQLLLELKEACTLMKRSITPETTRFWSDHILSLRDRLQALRTENEEILDSPIPQQQHKMFFEREQYNYQHQATIPNVASDVQSTAVMSDIRSTRGIPVVPALSQYSNDIDDHNKNDHQEQSNVNLIPGKGLQITNDFVQLVQKSQPREHSEIELSENRRRFEQSPSDEMYTHPHDSNLQQTIDNDDGYYEYPLVDVVAPADLPGGYHFEAEIEGQRFLATVPPGGVQQGETFTCYMKELDSVAIDIPVGEWKDGLCNMFELGWCHPVLWNAIFCPLIALGQIQNRVHLDFLGRPKFGELPYTNRFMMLLVIASWFGTNAALFAACNLKWSRGLELSVADGCAFALVNVAMFGFVVFVTQSTRSSVREKFMIRERCCYDLEDVCFAALCLPCAVGQMQRHTANYDDYEAVCCSKTGLPNGVRVNQEAAKVKETTVENDDGFMV